MGAAIDCTVTGGARARLDGIKRRLGYKGVDLETMRFCGVPLSHYGREDLLLILAEEAMRRADELGADLSICGGN